MGGRRPGSDKARNGNLFEVLRQEDKKRSFMCVASGVGHESVTPCCSAKSVSSAVNGGRGMWLEAHWEHVATLEADQGCIKSANEG